LDQRLKTTTFMGDTRTEAPGPAMPRQLDLDLELLCLVTVSWKGQRKQTEREKEVNLLTAPTTLSKTLLCL